MSNLIKKAMMVGFDKRQKPSMLLSNLFKKEQLDGISVEVQGRVVESIYSVDVKLGTGGRKVSFDKHDTKDFVVPEYNDFDEITEEDLFKVQLGETEYSKVAARIADKINDSQILIGNSQRRAEEKQASDGLFYGKITLSGGVEVKFNKKATHTISKASAKWNTTNGDPVTDIKNAIQLCVDDGLLSASEFNLWLEEAGLTALLANDNFRKNANIEQGIKRTDINMPVEKTPGGLFHGRVSIGSYIVNIWSYNEKYTIPTGYDFANEGTKVGYIPTGCALLVPMDTNFVRYYGAINDVNAPSNGIGGNKLQLVQTEQLPYAYDVLNDGSALTKAGVKSRPLYVPIDIDSFATFKDLV